MLSAAAACCSLGQREAALITQTHDTDATVALLGAQAM